MEPADFFNKTMAEAEAMEVPPYPGFFSRAINHPGLIGYETKTEDEWESDKRREYVLSRLAGEYRDSHLRSAWGSNPLVDDVAQYRKDPDSIGGLYRHRGVMAPGQPVHNALTWLGSAGSYVNDVGPKALANLADYTVSNATGGEYHPPYPNTLRDARRNMNTFLFQIPESVGMYESGSHMDDIAASRAKRSEGNSLGYSEGVRQLLEQYQDDELGKLLDSRMSDNVETLRESGAPEPVAMTAGTMFNAATDVFGPGGFLRAGRMPLKQGVKALAGDFLPEPALRLTPTAMNYINSLRTPPAYRPMTPSMPME